MLNEFFFVPKFSVTSFPSAVNCGCVSQIMPTGAINRIIFSNYGWYIVYKYFLKAKYCLKLECITAVF